MVQERGLATDADHVVVISTLLQREPGALRAARIAAWWGAGHSASFLGIGLLIVVFGVRVPIGFEHLAELLVALMLLGFGGLHLRGTLRQKADEEPASTPPGTSLARPALVGVVHGLAGSAGIALLASTTIESRALAAAYLGLFGLGSVLGMVLLTVVLSWPISWTVRRKGRARRLAGISAALLSVGLGAAMLLELAASARGT